MTREKGNTHWTESDRRKEREREIDICTLSARERVMADCVSGGWRQREKRIYKYSKDENSELYVDMAMVQQKLNK